MVLLPVRTRIVLELFDVLHFYSQQAQCHSSIQRISWDNDSPGSACLVWNPAQLGIVGEDTVPQAS